jgi:hypothetical protein
VANPPVEGVHIALMGIDGAGKSTIAAEIAAALNAAGRKTEIVSFKRAMATGDPFTAGILGHVAFASLTAQYAEAAFTDPAIDVPALLAAYPLDSYSAAEKAVRAADVDRNSAQPFLSSAFLEIVGGFWIQHHIDSRLCQGITVIDESYAFKHALKNLLFVRRLTEPGTPLRDTADSLLATARSVFGTLLRPAHGYWIDTDPRLAWRWRAAVEDEPTSFENYGLAGDTGESSFLEMQSDCRAAFADATSAWGWHRIVMEDRPRSDNLGRALEHIQRRVLTEHDLAGIAETA